MDGPGAGSASDERLSAQHLAAYEHVLREQEWSEASIAQSLGVPVSRAREVQSHLTSAGLLRPSQEDPQRLVPAAPLVGLGGVVAEAERTIGQRLDEIGRWRRAMQRLAEEHDARRLSAAASRFEELRGTDATVQQVSQALHEATSEVLTAVTSALPITALEQARRGDASLLERGVTVRAIYLEGHLRQSSALRAHLSWLGDHGAHIRMAPALPTRLMCIDRHTAAVAIDPDNPSAGGLLVSAPGIVAVVAALFELLWERSTPVGCPAPSAGPLGLSDVERSVLRLLSEGAKDEGVSRRTGLSVRSVRRTIAGLSERLGVRSRFELGVRCRDLGLLPTPTRPREGR